MAELLKSTKIGSEFVLQIWDKTNKPVEYNYIVDAFKNGRPLDYCKTFTTYNEAEKHYKKTYKTLKNEEKKTKQAKVNGKGIQKTNWTRFRKFLQWFKQRNN